MISQNHPISPWFREGSGCVLVRAEPLDCAESGAIRRNLGFHSTLSEFLLWHFYDVHVSLGCITKIFARNWGVHPARAIRWGTSKHVHTNRSTPPMVVASLQLPFDLSWPGELPFDISKHPACRHAEKSLSRWSEDATPGHRWCGG